MPHIPFTHPDSFDISYDRTEPQSPAIELDAGVPNRIDVVVRSRSERIPVAVGAHAVIRSGVVKLGK